MRTSLAIIMAVFTSSGCATSQLRFTATEQIATEPDIYTNQVMENLANMLEDATSMPYFTLLQSGVPSTTDMGTISIGFLNFPAQSVVRQLHRQRGGQIGPLGASRTVGANWAISPTNDPERLRAMRSLYLWVTNQPLPAMADPAELEASLRGYLGDKFRFDGVPQGWIRCGRWHDVPKEACKVIHHHKTFFWVVPGHEEQLTNLVLTMIDIATSNPHTGPPPPTQTVTKEYDPNDKLVRTMIATTSTLPPPSSGAVAPSTPGTYQVTTPSGTKVNVRIPPTRMDITPEISPGLLFAPRP